MSKFFYKAAFFLMTLGLILNLLGSLADSAAPLEDWQSDLGERYQILRSNFSQVEAVTVGNSHADSIDYKVMGIKGQSMALAAADLFEMEQYILLLENKTPKLATVFIAISYYSFGRDNSAFPSLRSRRIGFYSMLPIWAPIPGDAGNFVLGRLDGLTHVTSVARSDSWRGVWPELAHPLPEPISYDGIHTVSEWGRCDHYSAEQLDLHAQEIAWRNVSSTQQMMATHPGLEQDSFQALSRSIELLQRRGVRVVLFTPAYYEKYSAYFAEHDATIMDRMQDAVDRLQKTYHVEYYDFSKDPQFIQHPELFYNSDHVSNCGQKVLSEKLLMLLNESVTNDK